MPEQDELRGDERREDVLELANNGGVLIRDRELTPEVPARVGRPRPTRPLRLLS
jgi:hypothetical protein